MNPKLFVARSVRRLYDGRARLQKPDMKRIPFLVIVAAFGSLSLLFFQNFTNPPPQPFPPPNFVLKPIYKFTQYNGYPIPYVPRGNPKPMSPQVAVQNYLMQKAVSIASRQQITGDRGCQTVNVSYKDKDPKTNLALRTFTMVCAGNQVVTLNEIFDRGPNGSPVPVQLLVKSPLKTNNAQAAIRK